MLALPASATAEREGDGPVTILVRAARMVDVTTGKIVEHPEIEVSGSKTVAVRTGTGPWPSTVQVIDLLDVTLLPGLIDMHTHLTTVDDGEAANGPVH